MRIVIDMQGAQTESRFRGIGRYTMEFTQAVVRNRGEHEIILVLSGLFPNTIGPIRAAFEGLLPQENIRVWYAPGPVKEEQLGNDTRREVAELIREAFIASLNPDVVHITSLFEGYVDCAVTSIGRFNSKALVSVTLYDLIPLLNPEQYLQPNPRYQAYYQRKIDWLKKAAVMLGISDYACQEAKDALSIDSTKVVAISTAIESSFKKLDINNEQAANVLGKFGIKKPFLLYTGGADERKNLPRLIQAYAKLKQELRCEHQLVFAGRMTEGEVNNFSNIANENGLDDKDLIFTGYISEDDLVALYNLCKLYVFPSWHEGFGLPALEAMACGAPVIGANTTSLPEVIGWPEALFDPFDSAAIAQKIQQALTDQNFCQQLRENAKQQVGKFSWDKTAKLAIDTWARLGEKKSPETTKNVQPTQKLRLAFVSPLPPERTGIADYSAELLPALSRYYDLVVISDQHEVSTELFKQCDFTVENTSWLRSNRESIERVVYQVGNSPFHKHMIQLCKEIPGTVVMHDFYASGLMSWLSQSGEEPYAWERSLYEAHGYKAVVEAAEHPEEAKKIYPVNWEFIKNSLGVIVHSFYANRLADEWYKIPEDGWDYIPLVRAPRDIIDRENVYKELNIPDNSFLVCSFGFLDSTKLNHRLLESWLSSDLAKENNCYLIFVGENHGGEYGSEILSMMQKSGLNDRIKITGFATHDDFHKYLNCTDIAVQLRTQSRGETSAAVLDCMNYARPLIANANGSMAELDDEAVWKLPDEFTDAELTAALEELYHNKPRRIAMGKKARAIIEQQHSPEKCAAQYFQAIEAHHQSSQHSLGAVIEKLAEIELLDKAELLALSEALNHNFPAPEPAKQILVDITATCSHDLKTGIERVARAITLELLQSPPKGYRIEPVYLSNINGHWRYIYARKYTSKLIDIPECVLNDEAAEVSCGDIVIGLDLSGEAIIESVNSGYITRLRNAGVKIYFMVHDLLPISLPHTFPPNSDINHEKWLSAIAQTDGVVGVTKNVAEDYSSWLHQAGIHKTRRSFYIGYSHHGADINNSSPSKGLPSNCEATLRKLQTRPSFLMVGTIEPRKGYLETINAFDKLWQDGIDVNLVIVGKEGWQGLDDEMRRDIPETIKKLRNHPENGKRLFWLEGISDEYLEKVYANTSCLIAASYGEGFGLPLIEAAQQKLPIIARDIPVFREVAGDHAFYFDSKAPEALAASIQQWLALYQQDKHPRSDNMPWLTWGQSAENLLSVIFNKKLIK